MTSDDAVDAQVLESLRALGIGYEVMDCDPAYADTAQFCEKYGIPLAQSGNTIVVASRKEPRRFAACVVTALTRLDVNRSVRKLLGVRKVSFASAEETEERTGMMIGGVTIFGLPDEMPKYIDAHVMDLEYVVLGSGTRSSKLRVAPGELSKIPGLEVVEGLAIEAG